jgi:hypothetical protein
MNGGDIILVEVFGKGASDQTVINTFHYRSPTDYAHDMQVIADNAASIWCPLILGLVGDNYTSDYVAVKVLTGVYTGEFAYNYTYNGTAGGYLLDQLQEPLCVVLKRWAIPRTRKNRGRVCVPLVPDSWVGVNGVVTIPGGAADDFLHYLHTAAVLDGQNYVPVIFHSADSTYDDVQGSGVAVNVGTRRSRLIGHGS